MYVKILPASTQLENVCEKGAPYPGAKQHYIVDEEQLSIIDELPEILCAISESLPEKKKKAERPKKVQKKLCKTDP